MMKRVKKPTDWKCKVYMYIYISMSSLHSPIVEAMLLGGHHVSPAGTSIEYRITVVPTYSWGKKPDLYKTERDEIIPHFLKKSFICQGKRLS